MEKNERIEFALRIIALQVALPEGDELHFEQNATEFKVWLFSSFEGAGDQIIASGYSRQEGSLQRFVDIIGDYCDGRAKPVAVQNGFRFDFSLQRTE